jgi:hypothetical protein
MSRNWAYRLTWLLALTGAGCGAAPAGLGLPQYLVTATAMGQGTIEQVTDEGRTAFTEGMFAQDSTVKLAAVAAEGWIFVGWESPATTEPEITLTITADTTVQAVFKAVAGVRTVTVNGLIGRMTLAVKGNTVRGNRRTGDLGLDIEGTIIGNQVTLTDTAPGLQNATIGAKINADGSWTGTINGSGFSNSPFTADPVSLVGSMPPASQRTTTLDGVNGLLTLVHNGAIVRGTWRLFGDFGGDVEGTATGNQVVFTVTTPGIAPATVTCTVLGNGAWVGTANGSGFNNDPFEAQPAFFP